MNWLDHFQLRNPPFSKEIADEDLFLPDSKATLVDELFEALQEHTPVILLTADAGLGKTCVLRALRHRLGEGPIRLTYCHNATLGRRDFYRQLCQALGLAPKATAAAVFHTLSNHVQELGREHIHPVFLLDEAHLLHQDVLDHLHILSNYEWDARALMTLVLVGLPELSDQLRLRRNRALYTRIHCRKHIGDPLPADTNEYITHRLRLAGRDSHDLFTQDALALLHEASSGRLRDIDRIATEALKRAARNGLQLIDRPTIAAIAAEQQR